MSNPLTSSLPSVKLIDMETTTQEAKMQVKAGDRAKVALNSKKFWTVLEVRGTWVALDNPRDGWMPKVWMPLHEVTEVAS